MKIPVMFINGTLDVICGEELDEMLEKKFVVAFQRSSGLAIVGRDEIRNARGDDNGSWRDRKKNQPPREELMYLPPRPMLPSSGAHEMTQKRIEAALPNALPIYATAITELH